MSSSEGARRALVIGGTSGVGRGLAQWLAGKHVHVTVAGRSQERGGAVVEACREVWPEGEFDFMSVDAFSIKALADACAAYARSSSRLDYLVLTQGMATIQGYTPTDSGLDQKLVLHHFGRMASILALRDLLTTTSGKDGADVRVLSVLSAGVHSPLAAYKQDPILRNNYSIKNAADFAGFAQDLCLDGVSRETPGVAFVHAAPGFVRTNWGSEFPSALRWMVRGLQVFGKSEAACAAEMGKALVDPRYAGGFHLMGPTGNPVPKTKIHNDEAVEFMWKATKDAVLPAMTGQPTKSES
uniref:Protochlorophyllide reductase n=1 Tax=Tetraselmis chuii TaxID=63592 RepID=A0A7S1X7P1_9CHLO